MRKDVEAAITKPAVSAEPLPAALAPDTAADARTGLGIASRTSVRGVRKVVAANMSRSRSEIPEATVWVDVDATGLVELRGGLKKSDPHHTPGLLAFIARFVTAGLKRFPDLNTRIETAADGAQEIVGFAGINLGLTDPQPSSTTPRWRSSASGASSTCHGCWTGNSRSAGLPN